MIAVSVPRTALSAAHQLEIAIMGSYAAELLALEFADRVCCLCSKLRGR
jgi:hypothetical protein